MTLEQIKTVYFLGIGGIGMSAIARYFNSLGKTVLGYDKTETPLTQTLIKEGIQIHYTDKGSSLANLGLQTDSTLVVLTPAIPKNHEELNWFKQNNFNLLKRSQILGYITKNYTTIGVAGTHGKTTTSTLLAHILKQSSIDCGAFLGGISSNYNSNLLLHKTVSDDIKQLIVVEADEFDRSFLTLYPAYGIITSTDADHLDIYGEHSALLDSFLAYAKQITNTLFIKKELTLFNQLQSENLNCKVKSYSISQKADTYATNINIINHRYHFDLVHNNTSIDNLQLGIPGLHNVENATAAAAIALENGVSPNELRISLNTFNGVKRRFEYIINTPDLVYIDDYAHHPTEIEAFLGSVKKMYPSKKMLVVFQPHLFSRTRDFADGFAKALSMADELILLDIYPARELPIEGITSAIVFNQVTTAKKELISLDEALPLIKTKTFDVLVTLGAGDIDTLVNPIKTHLSSIN